MAEDLTLGECPKCARPIMLRTTTGGLVYGKCQGFQTEDGSHCGFSFQHGRKESISLIAAAAKAARKPKAEPKEEADDNETEPGPGTESDPAGNDDGGSGVFRRGRK